MQKNLGLKKTLGIKLQKPADKSDASIEAQPTALETKEIPSLRVAGQFLPTSLPSAEAVKTAATKEAEFKPKKIMRAAGGEIWEDPTLEDWDPNHFRLFVGNLGNEVTDNTLEDCFSQYSSFEKARVVRDKKSGKTKGYGFVSFRDVKDFLAALREWNGKYVGTRPCTLSRSRWEERSLSSNKRR